MAAPFVSSKRFVPKKKEAPAVVAIAAPQGQDSDCGSAVTHSTCADGVQWSRCHKCEDLCPWEGSKHVIMGICNNDACPNEPKYGHEDFIVCSDCGRWNEDDEWVCNDCGKEDGEDTDEDDEDDE